MLFLSHKNAGFSDGAIGVYYPVFHIVTLSVRPSLCYIHAL